MEQKDYVLREIEKIGLIVRAIRQKLFGGKDSLAINIEEQVAEAKGRLLSEMEFNLDKFLLMDAKQSSEYLSNFAGFNIDNFELLAECISQIGFSNNSHNSIIYLEKALQLYELCNLRSRTYSIERERSITKTKKALYN